MEHAGPARSVAARTGGSADPIVIVGMGCRYPGDTRSADDLWNLVTAEVDAVGPFPVNRGWDNPKSVWHNYRGKSLVVMGFGDGHASAYKFPLRPATDPFWTAAPNPAFPWW